MWAFMPSSRCRIGGTRGIALAASNAIRHGPGAEPFAFHSLERVEVEVGERDVPPLGPGAVDERAALDLVLHRDRRAHVGREEVLAFVAGRAHRLHQRVHARQAGRRSLPSAATRVRRASG